MRYDTQQQFNYHIPVNPVENSGDSQTIIILQILGTPYGRLALMTKYLKTTLVMVG